MLILLLTIVFLLIIGYLIYYCHYTKEFRLMNLIPGPYKIFIFANTSDFTKGPVKLFYANRNFCNKFKGIYWTQVGHKRVLNLCKAEDAEIILSSIKYITKSFIYDKIHPWLKTGLLTSTGEKWHQRRKILTPAFHFNILRHFCKTFDEQSKVLIKNIEAQGTGPIDVMAVISQYTINSICETAMGTRIETSDKTLFQQYKDAINEMAHYIITRVVKVWYQSDLVFMMSPMYQKQAKALSVLHNFSQAVIQQRRKERESGQGVKIVHGEDLERDDFFITGNKKRLAMLDLLLSNEADGKIDEDGIMEEVDTFMFEGHDTTSMGISFALMAIANRKDIQDKIVAELNEIFDDPESQTTMEDLNNMKYLELCIKESLRLYPSVPLISRHLDEEVKINKYVIPPNTACHINIYDIHRDPAVYPNPDEFIPERFTVENSSKRHPFAYIPFSAGPRNCIGQRFAMYELKSAIAHILRKFEMEPVTRPNDIVYCSNLVLRCRDPVYVKFIPRK